VKWRVDPTKRWAIRTPTPVEVNIVLNHTRIRRFSILAQDKTQFSTSHCPDISHPKYLGQRPHELLG
jgi:hypothetical protein